jgi:flagellar basal body-associated protein FliL
MARKVKLDVLEAHADDPLAVDAEPSLPGAASADHHVSTGGPFKKWIMPCAITLVFCTIAVGVFVVWTMMGQKNTKATSPDHAPVAVTPTTQGTMANIGEFVVDHRLQGGNVRIVTFALTLEFHAPVNDDAIQGNVDLREAIYTLSKRKDFSSLITPEERGALKKEIAAEVEKRLGAGVVKGVYFTKFCTL